MIKLVVMILVMPATNAASERSFSALYQLKTRLRSTMSQNWLNWCMMLSLHKEGMDQLQSINVSAELENLA